MTINVYLPHVIVLPEDDANADLANGFLLDPAVKQRRIQVMPVSGGWRNVVRDMLAEVPKMRSYSERYVVMLLDFDGVFSSRSQQVYSQIPADLKSRVFLLGSEQEPERLRVAMSLSLEKIGLHLAQDCAKQSHPPSPWDHAQLAHNAPEHRRLTASVRPIIF